MRKKRKGCKQIRAILFCLLLSFGFSIVVQAETLPCRSAKASGFYRHPVTDTIEDSGGETSEALGQSMVTNVVDTNAMLEENPEGGYYLSLRLHMTDNLSEILLSVQEPGDSDWEEVSYVETASGEDQKDLRLPVESEETIVRAECYVEAMGRSVIFYITLSDFTDGNTGGFVQMGSSEAEGAKESGSAENDVLDQATGLITGEGQTGSGNKGTTESTETAESVLSAETGEVSNNVQQLNLSGGVWWMLFTVIFCANLLAGAVLLAGKVFLAHVLKRKNILSEEIVEDETEEDDFNAQDLLDDYWEEPENEK